MISQSVSSSSSLVDKIFKFKQQFKTGYHYDTFLDLLIRVYKKQFVIGIYHKVDDFSFTVINFPFPESNIHSKVGYNAFYSQLVRFFRLCNNLADFLARVKLIYVKMYERGYSGDILYRYFVKCCSKYPVQQKYGVKDVQSLWRMSLDYRSGISCVIYDEDAVENVVKPCNAILKDIYGNIKSKHKSILKSCKVCLDRINISGTKTNSPNTKDISDDINLQHSSDLHNLSSINDEIHLPPQGLFNPSNHCYVNSVLQVASRVLANLNIDVQFNDNYEGKLVKTLIDSTKHMSNINLNDVKTLFGKFHRLFDGSRQQDAHECLMLLFDIFHQGTKYSLLSDVDDEESIISLKKQLFYFSFKHRFKCLQCNIDSSHFSYNYFHNIDPKYKHGITELLGYSLNSKPYKMCNVCHTNTLHNEVINFVQLPKILTIVVNRFHHIDIGHSNNTPIILKKHNYIYIYISTLLNTVSSHLYNIIVIRALLHLGIILPLFFTRISCIIVMTVTSKFIIIKISLTMCMLCFMLVMIDSFGGEDGVFCSPWGRTGSVLYTRIEDKAPKSYYQCHPPDDLISLTIVIFLICISRFALYTLCYHFACF